MEKYPCCTVRLDEEVPILGLLLSSLAQDTLGSWDRAEVTPLYIQYPAIKCGAKDLTGSPLLQFMVSAPPSLSALLGLWVSLHMQHYKTKKRAHAWCIMIAHHLLMNKNNNILSFCIIGHVLLIWRQLALVHRYACLFVLFVRLTLLSCINKRCVMVMDRLVHPLCCLVVLQSGALKGIPVL